MKPTLAIYGVPDVSESKYASLVHDHSLAFFKNSEIVKYLHLERLTRNKYDSHLPTHLYHILQQAKLLNIDHDVVFVDHFIGRSFINREGNIRFDATPYGQLPTTSSVHKGYWLGKQKDFYTLNHELAHIFSCLPFFGNFQENSLLFHFDGGASMGNFSLWTYKNNEIKLLQHGWDLKYLSTLFNANALVFGLVNANETNQNGAPGKFMGYAAYGKSDDNILKWLKNHDFFENYWRKRKGLYLAIEKEFGIHLDHLDLHQPVLMDIAATIHQYFISELLLFLRKQQQLTKTDYLYYSGGSALNIVANTQILREKLFKSVYIPPCPNDSGLSIGAGAFMEWMKHGKVNTTHPYLNNWGIEDQYTNYTMNDLEEVAHLLLQKKIIGICNGPGEAGPRALGNRSIIALPNDKGLAKKLNSRIKKREWYRPIAPIMLRENLHYYTSDDFPHHLSKYMLVDFNIEKSKIQTIKGAVHVDGTARIQTLEKRDENPFMFDLLELLWQKHQVMALLNTSFNEMGEPIVHTPQQAINSSKKMGLDAVVINGKLQVG